MLVAKIYVSRTDIKAEKVTPVTAGMVGAEVDVYFGREWDGYAKTYVWEHGGVSKDDTTCSGIIPPEVVAKSGGALKFGVYGTKDGKATPTLWCTVDVVKPGADPSGDESTDPTLPVWAQLREEIEKLKQESGGTITDEQIAAALEKYLAENPIEGISEEEVRQIIADYLAKNPVQDGKPGEDGGYYTPDVTQPTDDTMQVAFTPSKAGMPAVQPATVKLPVGSGSGSSPNINPVAKTDDMTQPVGVDAEGKLFTKPGGGSDETSESAVSDFAGYSGILFYAGGDYRGYNPVVNTVENNFRVAKFSSHIQNLAPGADVISTPGALAHEVAYHGYIASWVENVAGTTADVPTLDGITAVKGRIMTGISNFPAAGDYPRPDPKYKIITLAQMGDEAVNTLTGETFNILGGVGYQTNIDGKILCGYVPSYNKLKGMTIPVSLKGWDTIEVGTRSTWTLTIDGELGDYDYSRLPSPANTADLHPSNQVTKIGSTYYRADVVPTNGFVLVSSTDLINWTYIAHISLPDGFLSNGLYEVCLGAKRSRIYAAIRQNGTTRALYLAKLTGDNLSVDSIVALPDCSSRPWFYSSSGTRGDLILVTAPTDRYGCRVYDIPNEYEMTQLTPLFEVVGTACNYPFLAGRDHYLTIYGTNGKQTDKNGVSALPMYFDLSVLRKRTPNATDVAMWTCDGDVKYGNLYEMPPTITWYKVTNTLTNVSTGNIAKVARENKVYSATLTAADGYTLDSVTVTMDGTDITETAYDEGTVTIEAVTGDIVITASAAATTE